jgi:hypothetical protein
LWRSSLYLSLILLCACGTTPRARHVVPEPTQNLARMPETTSARLSSSNDEPDSAGKLIAEGHGTPLPVKHPGDLVASVSANGEDESEPFRLRAGPAVFQIQHLNATFFAAFLLDDAGEHLVVLANGTTPIEGTQFFGIEAGGDYHLHVIADDTWSITVTQPEPGSFLAPPSHHVFGGEGLAISPSMVLSSGRLEVGWQHGGTYPLAVSLWTVDGRATGRSVSNGGVPSGVATFDVPAPGTYLLNILADGPWSIQLTLPE